MSIPSKLSVWYWRQRLKIGRYIPDPVSGVGFSLNPDPSVGTGLELVLDVEGRTGTSFLSRKMWLHLGSLAGWSEPMAIEFKDGEFGSCSHGAVFTKVREYSPGKKVQDVFLRRKDGSIKELLAGAPNWLHAYHYASGFLTGADCKEVSVYTDAEISSLSPEELKMVCRTSSLGSRVGAIEALGAVEDLSTVEHAVLEFLSDDSPVIRESALYAAANWPAGSMVWDTVSAMVSGDAHVLVRSIAAETLEVMGEK